MEAAYLDQLPGDVRSLAEQIERETGSEIRVTVDPERAHHAADNPGYLSCNVDVHGAELLIPAPDHFPDSSVLHELLHIRRFLLEGVPHIIVCDTYTNWTPEFESALIRLDNALEHLIIVPEELNHRNERKSHWLSVMRRVLDNLRSQPLDNDDHKRHALMSWLFLNHVLPDPELISVAATLLDDLDIRERSDQFVADIAPLLNSKEKAVRACFDYLELPIEAGCLKYIDEIDVCAREVRLSEINVYPELLICPQY